MKISAQIGLVTKRRLFKNMEGKKKNAGKSANHKEILPNSFAMLAVHRKL